MAAAPPPRGGSVGEEEARRQLPEGAAGEDGAVPHQPRNYFELKTRPDQACSFPGFAANLASQPYSVVRPLRANIDETVLLVVITEQGENRNQCEEQRNLFGFSYGLARRGT